MNTLRPRRPPLAVQPLPLALRTPPPSGKGFRARQFTTIHSQDETWRTLLLSPSTLARGAAPDPCSFPSLLRACASLGAFSLALHLHQQAIVFGYHKDAYISSSLIHMYGKLGDLKSARHLFDVVPQRNVVPWSAIVGAYSLSGDVDAAFAMYRQMRLEGVEPNSVTILGLLSGIWEVQHLQRVHGNVIRNGLDLDTAVANSMTNAYLKCGHLGSARQLFDSMTRRDVISWNTMTLGYAQEGNVWESMDLFKRMRASDVDPDHQTFASLVSAITNGSGASTLLGESIYAQIVIWGINADKHVQTTLVVMHLKLKNINYAFLLFDQASGKDAVFWTAMISGLVQNDRADEALSLFWRMLRSGENPVTTTIASVLAACAQLGATKLGTSVHGYLIRWRIAPDVAVENSLVSMYAKNGCLKQCQYVFDMMQGRDVVSWNAVVSGYAQNGHLEGAFHFFNKMRYACLRPDSITMISLLKASASVGTLLHGKCIHSFIIKNQLDSSVPVGTSLIDMYSKCGDLEYAKYCFDTMQEQDMVLWGAIIASYGNHGKGDIALQMYSNFLHTGIEPNHIILLSVLTACSHAGLVLHGLWIFQSMVDDFRMVPCLEHYACVIDLLGRSGMLQEAVTFIRGMPHKPNVDVLGILLDACRIHRNTSLGEEIAREIIALKPESAGNYVQLAHSYATMNRWDAVGESWMRMRSLGLKKTPGWSFIELNGVITTFFMEHTSHPHHDELTKLLNILEKEMGNSIPEIELY